MIRFMKTKSLTMRHSHNPTNCNVYDIISIRSSPISSKRKRNLFCEKKTCSDSEELPEGDKYLQFGYGMESRSQF